MYTDCHIALTLIANIRAQMATQDTVTLSCGAAWPDIWRKGQTGYNHSFTARTCRSEFWLRRSEFINPNLNQELRVSYLGQADHYIQDACDCSKGTLGSPYSVYLRDLQWSISLFLLYHAHTGAWPQAANINKLVDELLEVYVAAIGQQPQNDEVILKPVNEGKEPPEVGSFPIDLKDKSQALSTGRYATIMEVLSKVDWQSELADMEAATAEYAKEIQSDGYDSAFVELSKYLYGLLKRRCHDIGMNCGTCDDAVKNGGDCFTSYTYLPVVQRTEGLTPKILEQFGQIYSLLDELYIWWRKTSRYTSP